MTGYTVAGLARFCGVTSRTVERWYASGKLPEPTRAKGAKVWTAAQARQIFNERKPNV